MRLTERSLFYWVLHRCVGLQILLLLVVVISLFFRVYPLEMQRRIINIAINLKMIDRLYLYCALYFGSVLAAGLLKYFANVLQEAIGQKILIDMRRELYRHILQLPLPFFHKTQTGSIVSAMTAELNAIATFLGGALAVPITSLLTFAVFLGFMIYLNPLLGLLSTIIYPFELTIIPLLQHWYNRYNRKRVATIRRLASLVNESVTGINEVQGNAGFPVEEKKLDRLIRRLYELVVKLSLFKYGIKFSNNLFQSFGPFLLFLVGGYLAIHGEFTLGALVAFLSAYEKVYDPWKEVIEYYQSYQDARVRYKQIMEFFDYEPDFLLSAPDREPPQFAGTIQAHNVGYQVNRSVQLLEDINFELPSGKHLALVGFSGSGKSTLSLVVGQLYKPSSGSITIDGHDIAVLSKTEAASNISSVAQHPFIFTGSVRENLLYACNSLILNKIRKNVPDRDELIGVVKEIGLTEDVIRWGLRSIILPQRAESMIPSFLTMRRIIRDKLHDEFSQAIEFYDAKAFLQYSSLAVNIIFGSYGVAYTTKKLLSNTEFRSFLRQTDLEKSLTELGFRIAELTIMLLGAFRGDDFFFQGSPMNQSQFDSYRELVRKSNKIGLDNLKPKHRDRFLLLALKFTPGFHKITTITRGLEEIILTARKSFLENVAGIDLESCMDPRGSLQTEIKSLPKEDSGNWNEPHFSPFCLNQYLYSHSLRDNILFGTVINQDLIRERLGAVTMVEFEQYGLLDDIIDIGLDYHVGSKGDNLSGGQKQKVALARALLKKSPVLILDEATASLDNRSQTRIHRYLRDKLHGRTTVMSVVHRLDMISEYDHILVMKEGKIVESGRYDDLMKQEGHLYELVYNKR